ncbi:MAG: hypothetical protein ACAI44_38715 [Candidatus Sericytochromatia bacterium]
MDAANLAINHTKPFDGPWRPQVEAKPKNEFNLPDLGEAPENEIRFRPDKLEFINPSFSADKPLVSLSFNQRESYMSRHGLGGQNNAFEADAKLRSPYLQHQARELGKELIQDPLKQAWRSREFDGSTALALGLGLGGVAAAVNSSSEIKTRVDLYKAEVGTLKIRPGIGITSGHGKVDYQGARLKISPIEQGNSRWDLDLDYAKRDERYGMTFNREVSRVRVGPSIGQSYFQAGITKDARLGTRASLGYHLSY